MKIREFFSIVPAFLASAALFVGCSPSQGPGMMGGGKGGAGMLGGPPMLEGGMKASLPRSFDATAFGKTEVEASKKACIDAREVAITFHSGPRFLNVAKTKKKSNGWTATCEVQEIAPEVGSQNSLAKSPVLDVDFKVCRVRNGTCKEINTGKFETLSGVPVLVGSTINTVFVSKNLMSVGLDGKITKAVDVLDDLSTGFEAVFTPIVDRNGRIRVAFTLDDSNLKEIKILKNGAQYPVVDKALVKSGTLDLSSGETKSVDLGKGFRMTVFAKEVIE